MSDVSVSLGVTGKDAVLGAFTQVGEAGKQMGETFGSIAGKLAGLAAGYVSISAAIGAFNGVMSEGGRLSDFSDQTGIATDKLVLLERAFENNGLKADDLGTVINKMQKFLVEAGEAGSESADKLHKIGLFSSELLQLSPDEQFQRIAKTISEIQDPAERAATSMEIFGKSGGKLSALFKDLPGEIANAQEEVGSYASIMGKTAQEFDALGDKIENGIGHKLTEFAAGALSNAVGGLETFADAIAKFDAAALGEKITRDIQAPLQAVADALMDGNFKQAFEVAYELAKLQAMKMGNTLMAAFSAAISGITTLFSESFGENSSILTLLQQSFRSVGFFISKVILEGLADVVSVIPVIGEKMAVGISEKAELASNKLANALNIVGNVAGDAGQQFEKATSKAADAAASAYNIAGSYFDVAAQQEKVQTMSEKIVSDHEAIAALTATIAANGKKYEESLVGAEQTFSQFKAIGGEAGNLGKMSGLDVPTKTYQGTGAGPIDNPSEFSTKMVHGTKSSGMTNSRSTDSLKDAMNSLLEKTDYYNTQTGYNRSFDQLQQTMETRASQKAQRDLSYYTGGDERASKQGAIDDLFRKYQEDVGGNPADLRKKAERDFEELVKKEQGPEDYKSGPGYDNKGKDGQRPPKDNNDGILGEIKKLVEKICNEKLPIQVLA